MDSIRVNLQEGALSFLDVCTCLTGYSEVNLENRLSTQAKTHALEHISKALTDSKSSFIRPGGTRRHKTHSITSPQQLVDILHDLLLHNRLTSGRGGKKVSTTELSQRIGDFIANFSGAFPGLWDHCDVQRLFTEATPCTTSNAPSHASQPADDASPPHISTHRQPVSPRRVRTYVRVCLFAWLNSYYTCQDGVIFSLITLVS